MSGKGDMIAAMRGNNAAEQPAKKKDPLEGLFSDTVQTENTSGYEMFPLSKLKYYQGEDPFNEYTEDELQELAESIAEVGILDALLVRESSDGDYEILAGKHRRKAAEIARLRSAPCRIMNVDDNTAQIIVMYTNYKRRKKVLISEKAKVFKKHLEILSKQGYRSDLHVKSHDAEDFCSEKTDVKNHDAADLCSEKTEVYSRDVVGKIYGVSGSTVTRHIKLLSLKASLLKKTDAEVIPFYVAYELTFLSAETQGRINSLIENDDMKVSKQAEDILNALRKEKTINVDELSDDELKDILMGKAPKVNPVVAQKIYKPYETAIKSFRKSVKARFKDIDEDTVSKISEEDMEEAMLAAVDEYIEKLRKEGDANG